ncbi:MAG: Hsp20 family protein [Anderseniella sp.]|nr:Hsp20 family protein [Anderseniella sp.]
MTMFDLTPLYRTGVGFDRLAKMLDEVNNFDAPSYPPYNIERTGEHEYRITMAVAGFTADELNIEVKNNALTVSGKKAEREDKQEFLHQGIAARNFERRFQLADHVEVTGAEMENGLLHVDLKREIPEAMKPRTIAINGGKGASKLIEDKKAA